MDRSVLVSTLYHLGHEAMGGSRAALQSLMNGLDVVEPIDWLKHTRCTRAEEAFSITACDAYGLAATRFLCEMSAPLLRTLRSHFEVRRGTPDEEHAAHDVQWNFGNPSFEGSYYSPVNPLAQLAGHAMHAQADIQDIVDFLRPMAGEVRHSESKISHDCRLDSGRAFGQIHNTWLSLYAQAVQSGNAAAVCALAEVFDDHVSMIKLPASNHSTTSRNGNKQENSLEICAKSNHAEVMGLMLNQMRASCDESTFLTWVGAALLHQVSESGLHTTGAWGQTTKRPHHDTSVAVFHTILSNGGQEFLDRYPRWVQAWAVKVDKEDAPAVAHQIAATKFLKTAEKVAAAAVNTCHPEAIAACLGIIDRAHHVDNDKSLKSPLLGLRLHNLGSAPGKTKDEIDRILNSFGSDFLANQISQHGVQVLHEAAKTGEFELALTLVDLGVDPMEKDERGWKAESHFKADLRPQWRSMLASRRAMAALQSTLDQFASGATSASP